MILRNPYHHVDIHVDGDVNLDHLAKVVSTGYLYCKVSMFPIIIDQYLGGGTWRLCKCTVSP